MSAPRCVLVIKRTPNGKWWRKRGGGKQGKFWEWIRMEPGEIVETAKKMQAEKEVPY